MLKLAPPKLPIPTLGNYNSHLIRTAGPESSPERGALSHRSIQILLNLTLLGLVVASFVTGWVASLLGLSEFGLHKYSSIALLFVAGGHLIVHWRSLTTQLRHLRTRTGRPQNPAHSRRWAQPDSNPESSSLPT
jgi:hypothetical protein